MSNESSRKKKAVVSGDLAIDWNVALTTNASDNIHNPEKWKDTGAIAHMQYGGSALLASIIKSIALDLEKESQQAWEIFDVDVNQNCLAPHQKNYHHSHAIWHYYAPPFPAWRVKEFLGISKGNMEQVARWHKINEEPCQADLVVLDDADLGFRDCKELWPKAILELHPSTWILLKIARPIACGALWDYLLEHFADRLIVVMSANDLRRTEVQISRELSWERTSRDLYWELTHNPKVNSLSQCAHIIVSFDTAGAFHLSKNSSKNGAQGKELYQAALFFDPLIVEGMWSQQFPGGMIGYTSCLTAGIANQLMLDPSSPSIDKGIQSGLSAMRMLHQKGYSFFQHPQHGNQLSFPLETIVQELSRPSICFENSRIPFPNRNANFMEKSDKKSMQFEKWSILQDCCDSLKKVAHHIVMDGVEKALVGVPIGKFGKLVTADRREIESFRSIRSLIGEYCEQRQHKPLSIAVFGPPGSGKSFTVSQIAQSSSPDDIIPLSFNLSQFNTIEDLYDAFHRIRDTALKGKIPLVFWDEFDCIFNQKPMGWLRYFLAPMHDGTFQEGQIVHPIGRSIFVFAGGVYSSLNEFVNTSGVEDFSMVKGPDFISRLKGYVDILGPNPNLADQGKEDPYYLIRRSIILRVLLELNVPQIFSSYKGMKRPNIDQGVLRALLHVSSYKHGVRSIESILSMSSLSGKSSFERSSLPPEAQLKLHVNGNEFLYLVKHLELEGEILENITQSMHQVYLSQSKKEGWKYGEIKNNEEKISPFLKPYHELHETLKEKCRDKIRNLPTVLMAAGYILVPMKSQDQAYCFSSKELGKLAQLKHHLSTKQYSDQFNLKQSWKNLPGELQKEEIKLLSEMPDILAKAGYAVIKIDEDESFE